MALCLCAASAAVAEHTEPSAEAVAAWRRGHKAYGALELPSAFKEFEEAKALGFDAPSTEYFFS